MIPLPDIQVIGTFLQSNPVTCLSLVTLIVFALILQVRGRQQLEAPLYVWDTHASGSANKRWMWDSLKLLQEGYQKFYNQPFQLWTTEGTQLVLPPKYIDELKMLPDHTIESSLREFMQPTYTMTPSEPWKLDYVNYVIKRDLNKNMPQVFPGLREEIEFGFPLEFPVCEDWTQVPVYPSVLRLICRTAGRTFVGTGLSRTEEWIQISCQYTKDIFRAAAKLRMIPSILRPIGKYFVSEIRKVLHHNNRARDLLIPVIQRRESEKNTNNYEKPVDAIQWIIDVLPDADKRDYGFQGIAQLAIGAVSIHTTTQLVTNAIFNLATYPEYLTTLRDEVNEVLGESGGILTLESMAKLEKMDSFLKESLRHDTPTTITFQRKVRKPITLHDGLRLPTGTLLFSPSNAISNDDTIYPEPSKFDGLRFYNLRHSSIENQGKYHLTSTSNTQMLFGGGRHACPGRWFASHEAKLFLANLLQRYDVKLEDKQERPKNIQFQAQNVPNPTATVLFRSRKI